MSTMNIQPDSALFRLPLELRHRVCCIFFSSTILTAKTFVLRKAPNQKIRDPIQRLMAASTVKLVKNASVPMDRPPSYTLSLLRTCRRLSSEIGSSWLRYVIFEFELLEDLTTTLSPLPPPILAQIRHMNISSALLGYLMDKAPNQPIRDRNSSVMQLLQSLHLNTLTVYQPARYCRADMIYGVLDRLISRSNNWWGKLDYYTANSTMLDEHYQQKATQDFHWRQSLPSDDGTIVLGSRVTVLRSTDDLLETGSYWRQDSAYEPLQMQELSAHVHEFDECTISDAEVDRRLLVRVRKCAEIT